MDTVSLNISPNINHMLQGLHTIYASLAFNIANSLEVQSTIGTTRFELYLANSYILFNSHHNSLNPYIFIDIYIQSNSNHGSFTGPCTNTITIIMINVKYYKHLSSI